MGRTSFIGGLTVAATLVTSAIPAPITRPLPVPNVQLLFGTLTIRIRTGDDDLRSDSQAWIELRFKDGGFNKCMVKDVFEATWGNNTPHAAPACTLSPAKSLSDLKSAAIALRYDGSPFPTDPLVTMFNTQDNWNVNEVHILATTLARNAQACVLDATGNPLVRLTGEQPGLLFDQKSRSC
jgi:hypothetical protein